MKVIVTLESKDQGKTWVVVRRFFIQGFDVEGMVFNEGDILTIKSVE
jgi:hypothetical protein